MPFSITSDFLVSIDTGIFLLIDFNILFILFHSTFAFTPLEPGRVDSPPTSIISAPDKNIFFACLTPLFLLLNFPPSEKLSGVRFNTPIKFGSLRKLRFEKFFFFVAIFFKSRDIFFFINLDKVLILLTDGADTGSRMSPLNAAQIAKQSQLKIFTIGIGDEHADGQYRVDFATLKKIASTADGQFYSAQDSQSLEKIYQQIDQIAAVVTPVITTRKETSLVHLPLYCALLIFVLALLAQVIIELFKQKQQTEDVNDV